MKQKYIVEIDEYGTTRYYNEQGQLHRLDGPAVIWDDGTVEYRLNGKPHRLDGPAVIWKDGTEFWYNNGKLHRLDGPSCIYPDGEENYYLEGKKYSKAEYYKNISKSNQDISITKDEGYITIKIKV